ncbi:hypothetical protein LWM68_05575 [Niabella sp. W65]|nr:hypothetical protein [Niabella sp. W65]MCH7362278.1 hypothetical protein [Niabella sp. W65]
MNSKAINGNSDESLHYEFLLSLDTNNLAFVWGGLAFACSLLFLRRSKAAGMLLMTGIVVVVSVISCTKQDAGIEGKEEKVFIRLKQINKDGTFEYSKIIQAVRK